MNLSGTMTTSGGKYDFSRLNQSVATAGFLEHLLQNRHLMYDWGAHNFFACQVPFCVNYNEGKIVKADGGTVDDSLWIGCDPEDLHQLLIDVFEGEWGPSAVDTITRLMCSGVEVDIFNTKNFGPEDPKGFLDTLKRNLS